ncbi:MAG: hypothetical protein WA728_36660, partial [Xanthobacteraceae bacterium]
MEEFDLTKALGEVFKPTDPPTEATLTNMTEAPTEAVLPNTTEAATEATLTNMTEAPTEAVLTNTTEAATEATLTNTTEAPTEATLTNTTEAPTEATIANTTEAANPISFELILSRLSPEGQAWLNGFNHDLEKDEVFSAAVNGLPKVVDLITAAPEEKRSLALAAAHQAYLRT